jgi:HAD superfamily hydrolase (TIGR01509 family)
MRPAGRFRALSLDLWFTTLSYLPGDDEEWEAERLRTLVGLLERPLGGRFDDAEVAAAADSARARLRAGGLRSELIDPGRFVTEVASALSAGLTTSPEAAASIYSDAGLDARPPSVNPEVVRVVERLDGRGIPVISITNTARREATWRRFFSSRGLGRIRHVVTSCELGIAKPRPEIFLEAARRLGVAPEEILHVGDRWELDVDGAIAAGCGAALYRGLWPLYPEGLYLPTTAARGDTSRIRVLDRLDELAVAGLWSGD